MSKDNRIFIETVRVETQTVYMENGEVRTYPCPWELGEHITMSERVSQQGKLVTEHDGTSHFVPYGHKVGGRYKMVYRSAHCTAKQTQSDWIVTFRFPVAVRLKELYALLREEAKTFYGTLLAQGGTMMGTRAASLMHGTVIVDQNKGGNV
ncbi:MAG: hypothetical protein MJZ77_05535 [Bacteroidales bacterium]|nr:hypothetical protein [Bacteroidales bacterium]